MRELSSATHERNLQTEVMDSKLVPSSIPYIARQPAEKLSNGLEEGNGTSSQVKSQFMQPTETSPKRTESAIKKMSQIIGAFGKFMFSAFSVIMYLIGLFGFLCGASVPVITLWFFMNVDTQFHWWHFILGIGGNIGIFIMSMTMIRDLYVQPLIEKIESAQARAEWGEPPAR